jgi:hypothetical protein
MFVQEIEYLYSKLPTDKNIPAGEAVVDSPTIVEWHLSA